MLKFHLIYKLEKLLLFRVKNVILWYVKANLNGFKTSKSFCMVMSLTSLDHIRLKIKMLRYKWLMRKSLKRIFMLLLNSIGSDVHQRNSAMKGQGCCCVAWLAVTCRLLHQSSHCRAVHSLEQTCYDEANFILCIKNWLFLKYFLAELKFRSDTVLEKYW